MVNVDSFLDAQKPAVRILTQALALSSLFILRPIILATDKT